MPSTTGRNPELTTLLWTPRAKQRPRSHVVNGRVLTYTPRETTQAERSLAEQWVAAHGDEPLKGPIGVHILLGDSNVDVLVAAEDPPESRKLRGDIDNYAKLVMDALNGVAWVDDRQIVELFTRKM